MADRNPQAESQPPASDAMYPSLEELLARYHYTDIPAEIIEDLRQRYDEHGWEYVDAGVPHEDGRPINTCMEADSARLAREELTDAVFNLLVMNLKGESWSAQAALAYVLHAWVLLSPPRGSGTS